MNFVPAWSRYAIAIALGALCAGCSPSGQGDYDEMKDTHFLQGKRRQQNMDYRGAAEAFENALEANPKSSAAHFELGLLYAEEMNKDVTAPEERDRHHATAIYHLEKFLLLNPQSPLADRVQQQITACKLELARTVGFTLLSSTVQNEFERLNATNSVLRQQTEQLKLRLAQQAYAYSNQFAAMQSQYLAALNAATNRPSTISSNNGAVLSDQTARGPVPIPATVPSVRAPEARSPVADRPAPLPSRSADVAGAKGHVVRSGDTLASIARKYGVSLNALTTANPGVEPRRLKVGQTIKIPAPRGN